MIKESKEGNYNYLNYFINNKKVGYLEYQLIYDTLDITNLYIEEEYRRKGYAKELLNKLKTKPQKRIMLEVNEKNNSAINLYRSFGFNTITTRKKYYGDDDALIMVKYMKDIYILGIETSCDETSVSIVKNGKIDISTVINTQIDIHKNYGGVVPEIASRLHLENITMVIEETLNKANMSFEDVDAFACTYGPGLLGSLLVGVEVTKTLSLIYNKPFIKVNHMMGHIYANKIGNELQFPLLALVISGGHTDLIKMENELDFTYIGQTLDDAVGECYDKVARILDIPYPGGPNLEKLANLGKNSYKMPDLMKDDAYNFSFSGIKSYVNNLAHNEKQRGNKIIPEDLANSFQKAVTDSLVNKTRKALKDFKIQNLIIAGGVSSNNYIREHLTQMAKDENINLCIPDKKYCTDNATMIAAAAYPLFLKGDFAGLDTNAKSNLKLK